MKIGELKHRVVIQKLQININTNGFEVEQWQEYKKVWAAVSNLSGREYYQAASIQEEKTIKFLIRYIGGLDTSMRVLFNSKQYNITYINNVNFQNRYIEIRALEVESCGEN